MPRRQILCISGGGYAGLFAAKLLASLEEQLEPQANIGQRFDAFAGTSIGGLIALALANGKSARKVLEVMQLVGPQVFPPQRGGMFRALFAPKRQVEALRGPLQGLFHTGKMGGVRRPTLITAVELSTAQPKLFRSFPATNNPDTEIPLMDVGLATSAAPIYFPPHKIGTSLFADGGLVANMPDHLAILEALDTWGWSRSDIHVLSIGTTFTPAGLVTDSVNGWGVTKWADKKKLLTISMSAQMGLATNIANRLVPADHILRIDAALSPAQAKAIGLDVASKAAIDTLQALASSELSKISPLIKNQFLRHMPVSI